MLEFGRCDWLPFVGVQFLMIVDRILIRYGTIMSVTNASDVTGIKSKQLLWTPAADRRAVNESKAAAAGVQMLDHMRDTRHIDAASMVSRPHAACGMWGCWGHAMIDRAKRTIERHGVVSHAAIVGQEPRSRHE
jgi:hypothetical protein